MRTSQLVARKQRIHRRVGVVVPDGVSAVQLAVRLYRECGIDVEIAGRTLYVEVGAVFAVAVQQAMERSTGIRGFNGWE